MDAVEENAITTENLPRDATIVIGKIREKQCPFCNKIFEKEKDLVDHLEKDHPKEWEEWRKALPLSDTPEPQIENLIADWKSYDPMKLIDDPAQRRVLADDHRIVHTWWKNLLHGKPMVSKQFKEYNLTEQKKIVRDLHEKIVAAMEKLQWKHRSPLGAETLIASVGAIGVADLEQVDEPYTQGLSDKELKVAYKRLHWIYHNVLKKITEPLQNAHIFVWKELQRRNIEFDLIGDKLDKATRLEVVEYPKPVGASEERIENIPQWETDSLSKALPLNDALDAFPDLIVLDEDPIHVYLCGRIVNTGISPVDHDVDILFKQGFPDVRIIHSFVEGVSEKNKDLSRRLHFVWDPSGPEIGYSVPLYRLAYVKVSPEEMRRTHPFEYLASWVKPFRPVRMLKPKSGFDKNEFFDTQEFWNKWASKIIDKGIIVQKKYDGMRFQIHVEGDQIKIITEDKQRDRAHVFKDSTSELISKKKAKSFVIDAEMVEYDCSNKAVSDMEAICTPLKREQMIPWVTSTQREMKDENIVFHVHDCLYLNGADIHDKTYEERWNAIKQIFPESLKHWRRVPGIYVRDMRSFFRAVEKTRKIRGSEGVVAKLKDSVYKTTGRTGEWAKLKNLKEIDVMVWDVVPKKTKEGKELDQWIYYPIFLIPCGMKDQIREGQVVEEKGKCYARIGRAYGTAERAQRGDIIIVKPIQIVENKDPKTGKIWWSWMFPYFAGKKPEKHEPDTLDTVRKIVKAGTAPLSEQLTTSIKLAPCPYWNDPLICALRERFYVPKEALSAETVLEEYLKYPIVCRFANSFKCHFVKDYYYDLKPQEDENLEGEELEED